MSYDAIISAASAALTSTSTFEDGKNISWMDAGVIDSSGACRWCAILGPGPVRTEQMTYGTANVNSVVWSLTLSVWVRYQGNVSEWQTDTKTVIQDVVDAFSADNTLGGACEDVDFELVDVDSQNVGGREYNTFLWLLEPVEWQ